MKAVSRARLAASPDQELFSVGCDNFSIGRYSVPIWFCRCRIAISSGSELASV